MSDVLLISDNAYTDKEELRRKLNEAKKLMKEKHGRVYTDFPNKEFYDGLEDIAINDVLEECFGKDIIYLENLIRRNALTEDIKLIINNVSSLIILSKYDYEDIIKKYGEKEIIYVD